MGRHRTTARGVLPLLFLTLFAGAASARPSAPPDRDRGVTARIIFPVLGPAEYQDDFGDPRSQGRHEGIDILAPRRALAVAAEDGTVTFWRTSPGSGCMLYLHGRSGTTYRYIHLNNDLTSGNDNRGKCVAGVAYAESLHNGDRVEAGQPVGYVGDSGDANGIATHLHFEVHPRDGQAVNPYRFLNVARRLLFAAPPDATVTLTLSGSVISAAAGELRLQVELLRVWPTGLRVPKVGRPLTLAVPPTALIDTGAGGPPGLATQVPSALTGQTVVVLTSPTPVTLAAELGEDGTFAVARIASVR